MRKSQSQKIRSLIYLIWWTENVQEDFETYYEKFTHHIIKQLEHRLSKGSMGDGKSM